MSPWLPTKLGSSTIDLMGSLLPLDYPSSLNGENAGMMVMGFIPFSFHQGARTQWCKEGQCNIRLSQGRFDALCLSLHDEISIVNARIETTVQSGSYQWTITVSDFPETVVGVHATKDDLKRTIDVFAGLTNWSQVANKLGLSSFISIDNCEEVANAGAKNLMVSKWGANELIEHWAHDFGRTYKGKPIMVVADVRNPYIREPLSHYRCGLMLGSPPCQPWSWLSSRMGLSDDRGKLFLSTADLAEFLGCFIIDLENVAGVIQHADWESVVAYFRAKGYALIYHGIDSLQGYLPVNRSRANVIFARFDFHHVSIPANLQLSESIWGDLSAKSFGVIHKQYNLTDPTLHLLTNIDEEDSKILCDPNYFTKDVADRVKSGVNPLAARSKSSIGPLPCPTARYGSPGLLSEKTLSDNKLTMILHRDEDSYRWFSPFEFLTGLGLPISTMLPIDRQIAFLAVGNTISPLHVALNINRALFCMGNDQRKVRAIASIVQQFAERQIPIHMCDVQYDEEVMWLAPKLDPRTKVGPPNVEELVDGNSHHLKRKHENGNQVGHDVGVKCAKKDEELMKTKVIILNQQCTEMTLQKHDERMMMKHFLQTISHQNFLMLFCEEEVCGKNLSQIREVIAQAKNHALNVVKQYAALNDPLVPTVCKNDASDFIPCWIQVPSGFDHRECSHQATFRELASIVEHPIVTVVVPGVLDEQVSLPKDTRNDDVEVMNVAAPDEDDPTTAINPLQHVKGVWIRCGHMGEVHQIWVNPHMKIREVLKRYQIPGFTCQALVNGRLKHDDDTCCEIHDVIEIRQCVITPPRTSTRYNDVLGDVIVTKEDRVFLQDPSTVLLRQDQVDQSEIWEHEIFQVLTGLDVPPNHVAVVLESCNWRDVIVVCKGVRVADIIVKTFGSTDAVRCVRCKNNIIDWSFTCHRQMTLQIEFQCKLKFIRFIMATRVFAMKVKAYHKGIDCKALIASRTGVPIGMIRFFQGFRQVQDHDSLWNDHSVIEARTFPMKGGSSHVNTRMMINDPNHEMQSSSVHTASPDSVDDTQRYVELWMKSPIDGKNMIVNVASTDTIKMAYERLLPDHPVAMFTCNGKIVPADSICSRFEHDVVTCRFFPLLGGAKGKSKGDGKGEEKMKVSNQAKALDFMNDQLAKRGVPKDACADRAKRVVAAVSVDFIIKHMDGSDFWQQLKNEASKQMVRLILPSELKAWQQTKRTESRQEVAKNKKGVNPALNPKDLVLQVKDFQADNKALPWISEDAIKPDSTGVCLLAPSNAKHFLPPKKLSADGLAIVTLGVLAPNEPQIQFIVTSSIGEDFVVRGNLFQFGDIQVVHCPACPTATVQEVASSVIEVIIGKECPSWSLAVADAIAAITKMDPQSKLREAVVGHWKFRPYDHNREPVSSEEAAHIHGYIRVRDSMIDDILKLSGQNATFFNTRVNGGGKDDRFSFIPLPDMSFDEAKCKAQTIQFSLGVVKGRGHYTLRCRREHYKKVMKQMNPDMTFGESSDDEGDMQSKFRLEGIHIQTTAHELTGALKSLGWKAKALRATGASSWLVIAESEPRNRSFSLNNQLVVVKDLVPKTALKHFVVSAPVASTELQGKPVQSVPVNSGPVTTRIEKIESELDQKIQKMVDKQMQEAAAKIDKLEESVKAQEQSQHELKNQFDQQRVELAKVSTQITDVASELQSTQASMLSSFESLIKSEMKSLHQKLATDRDESEEKRRRKE